MKNLFLTILTLIISSTLSAQTNLITTPEKPHPGDVVKFVYTPPSHLAGEKEPLHCTVFRMSNTVDFNGVLFPLGKPLELEIKKTGDSYSGEVITEETTCGLMFRFSWGKLAIDKKGMCTSGKLDNNNKMGYFTPLYTADNKPCPTAYARMAMYLSDSYYNNWHFSNLPLAREYYEKEMEYYPETNSAIAVFMLMDTFDPKSDSVEEQNFATKQLEKLFKQKPITDADYVACVMYFGVLGLKNTAAYFFEYASKNNIGYLHQVSSIDERYMAETDLTKKRVLLDSLIFSFKGMDFYMRLLSAYGGRFLSSYADEYLLAAYKTGDKSKFDEALRYIQHDINCGFDQLFPYLQLAEAAIELKNYDEALVFCNNYYAVCDTKYTQLKNNPGAYKNQDLEEVYQTTEYKMFINYLTRFRIAEKQALVYMLKGDCEQSLAKLEECYRYIESPQVKELGINEKNLNSILLSTNFTVIGKCKPLDDAIKSMEKIIYDGVYNEKAIEVLKELYVRKNGNDSGFNEYMAGLKNTNNPEIAQNLEEKKSNEPAPDFTLVDMDGKQVKLSALRGKTVILDFWATWCGPCRASFPAMQQLVEMYKSNPDVVFLFIDTFEGRSGETTVEKMREGAKKIMEEKKFSFHVVFDPGDEVAKKFKVKSIPAKFVIDKTGTIRYKAVGGGLFSDLVEEMNAMIKAVQ